MLILLYYVIHALYIEFYIVAISKSDTRCWLFFVCLWVQSVSKIEICTVAARYILEIPAYITVIL